MRCAAAAPGCVGCSYRDLCGIDLGRRQTRPTAAPIFWARDIASDGDSLRVQGDRVRLLRIDAPELDQVCWNEAGAEWTCGRAAKAELARLVAAGPVDCQPEGTDKYGRTLAVCAVAGKDVGGAVVEAGLALGAGWLRSAAICGKKGWARALEWTLRRPSGVARPRPIRRPRTQRVRKPLDMAQGVDRRKDFALKWVCGGACCDKSTV